MNKNRRGSLIHNTWKLPSLASYEGRYLYLALVLTIILLALSWVGYDTVARSTVEHISRTNARAATEKLLETDFQALQNIENWLNHQVMQPGIRQQTSPDTLIAKLETGVALLTTNNQLLGPDEERLGQQLINDDIPRLTGNIVEFLRISYDNNLRFPASLTMELHMQPLASEITSIFDNLILQADNEHENWELMSLLVDARHAWQQTLSEFRLMVANRFGVFSDDPEAGIKARATNIDLYFEQLQKLLDEVHDISLQAALFLLDEQTWNELHRKTLEWKRHYRSLLNGLSSNDWRQDLHWHNQVLAPQIKTIRNKLQSIKHHLRVQGENDVKQLTELASNLTRTIALLALSGALLIFIGYLFLRFSILKPMSRIAHALRLEASGGNEHPLPNPKLRETRELVEAFNEMRHQIIKRQQGLDYLAHHDPLTRLPNRILFKDRLQHAVAIAHRNHQCIALLFLDLDNFKQINDTLGHRAGDKLLMEVAYRVTSVVRDTDTVARLGGDEFAILLENIHTEAEACNIAQKVLDCLVSPFFISDHEFHVTCSIGIAAAPCNAPYSDDLIRDADTAMYEAKRQGKNKYHCYSSKLFDRVTSQLTLENDLRKAISNDELLYHYQPIVDARSNELLEVEALLRWQPSSGDIRYPEEFMTCLLNLKQEQELHQYLLEDLQRLQERFLKRYDIRLPIAINMSPCTLRHPVRHQQFMKILRSLRHPELLSIEINEDTLIDDISEAQSFLGELKSLGTPLSLDDFGTGQSSLNHLRYFPFDRIKVDKEFISNLPHNKEDAMLVSAIIQLAHNFGMKVVAEGVETKAQRNFLIEAGCDYLQGFLISRPVSEEALYDTLCNLRKMKFVNANF